MAGTQEFGIGLIGLGIGQQHLLGYQRQGLRVTAICDKGTKGAIYGNSEDMTVHLTEPETREIKPLIDGTWFPDAFGNVMAHFLECLQTGEKPITNGRSNLHVVQTLFAMHQSAKSGNVVLIDDISLNGDYDLSPHRVHSADDTSILQ